MVSRDIETSSKLLVSAQEQSCVKPDASTFPGGMIRCDEEVLHSSKCIFMCFGGKVVEGTSSLECVNGSFNGQIPKCIDPADVICNDCCDWSFRDVENASVTCTDDNKKKSECSVVCDEGFELDGGAQAKCTKGGWNKAAPTCVQGENINQYLTRIIILFVFRGLHHTRAANDAE